MKAKVAMRSRRRVLQRFLHYKLLRQPVIKLTPLPLKPQIANLVARIEIREETLRGLTPVADFLNRWASCQIVNVIDVGCFRGTFLEMFQSLIRKKVFSVGIDPIRHCHVVPYSVFVEVAITNDLEGLKDFFVYSDSSSSSLRKAVSPYSKALAVKTVKAFHLSTIIEQLKMENKVIHFLKIDVQGGDLEALLSLGKYIENCLFVQFETIYSRNKNSVLYENQTIFEEERPILEKMGFKLCNCLPHAHAMHPNSPEADVIFVNEELVSRYRRAR